MFGLPQRPNLAIAPPIPRVNNLNPTAPLSDKYTSVFVGSITPGVTDELIENLLKTCGKLRSWQRATDSHGKPQGFGFAVYENADAVWRALRVLGEFHDSNPLTLYSSNPSIPPKQLKLSIDDTVSKYIDEYKKKFPTINASQDEQAKNKVLAYIAPFIPEQKPVSIADNFLSSLNEISSSAPWNSSPKHENKSERKSQSIEQSHDGRNDNQRQSRFDKKNNDNSEKSRFDKKNNELVDKLFDDPDDTEKEDAYQREKKKREINSIYYDREKKWESHESLKLKKISRDNEKEVTFIKDKEAMAKKLESFDDDVEKDREDFFRDRQRYLSRREAFRQREEQRDSIDRKQQGSDQPILLNKTIISETKPLLNQPTDQIETGVVGRILTKEEREKAMTKLNQRIPNLRVDLYAYPVKWEFCDKHIIEKKIKPFINVKIREFLGEDEPDLQAFILQLLETQKSPIEIENSLEGPLDEDAGLFVEELWRLVILETECKSEGLS